MEPGRGLLDGVGAQARQAARTEPALAWRGRHEFHRHRWRVAADAPRRALCHQPRRGYPAAARRRSGAHRQDGSSAEPAGGRSTSRTGDRRLRNSPAACHSGASRRTGVFDFPRCIFRPERHRSLRVRRIGRLPRHVQRGIVHGEGNLRRRRLPGSLRFSKVYFPARAASIPTRSPYRTSTKTCSARDRTRGRESTTSPSSRQSSIFQGVFSGPSGIDPYAFAVSDVYQDMFSEGSYTGKGIYDVAVFQAVLEGRVADNRLLSHDLFEGIYARCGLASDVEVVEAYPSRYDVATARQHRWTRGDCQLLPWILGFPSAVPVLGRAKLLDNPRRSLQFPACVAALVLSWLGPAPLGWTLFLLAAMIFPVAIPLGVRLAPRFADLSSRGYLGAARSDLKSSLSLLALRLIFWADSAWIISDAIWRAVYRMTVSHRHLLEWTATAQSKARASSSWFGTYRRMGGGVFLCVTIAVLLTASPHGFTWIAAPFLLAWACAPAIARLVSRPAPAARLEPLTAGDRHTFRMIARQTWSFFDTFVTGRHNMLPPDNFQEAPNAVVANRTSPTNIGLYLLSVVAVSLKKRKG